MNLTWLDSVAILCFGVDVSSFDICDISAAVSDNNDWPSCHEQTFKPNNSSNTLHSALFVAKIVDS